MGDDRVCDHRSSANSTSKIIMQHERSKEVDEKGHEQQDQEGRGKGWPHHSLYSSEDDNNQWGVDIGSSTPEFLPCSVQELGIMTTKRMN